MATIGFCGARSCSRLFLEKFHSKISNFGCILATPRDLSDNIF